MLNNQFFKKKGPFPLKKILKAVDSSTSVTTDYEIHGIQDLFHASSNDITFLHSSKYKNDSVNTKALACITSEKLSQYLPSKCIKIIVDNVFFAVAKISKLFYPDGDIDHLDKYLQNSSNVKNKYPEVLFGTNVLIGSDVKIGKFSSIGSNTIVESKVEIGSNCFIGSSVVIRNAIIENNVYIQDGSIIGKKGFGFIPQKNNNLRIPQVGKIIIKEGVEIGSNCTLDRGSLSDTIIGSNTFLDNQVHLAHNVKIGNNCILAGQVGVAGSSTIGNNVMIGGQAGISGHLTIGNNVKIGGGSGVVNNIPDNTQVMGYPAVSLKDFVKQKKI